MLTVKTYVTQSGIQGLGVFASELIKKGTVIWKYQHNFDQKLTISEFEELPDIAKESVLHRGYYNAEGYEYVICGDNACFTNHSKTPNTEMDGLYTYALVDINPGDEITEDYYMFDGNADIKLNG